MNIHSSAHFQAALAEAIRNPEQPIPNQIDSKRLTIYRRLIRNNLRQFIDRCFSESLTFLETEHWEALQQKFLAEAYPESPYFNDIPIQFLQYLQTHHAALNLPESILALMDFEATQLQAEIEQTEHSVHEWHEQTPLTWSKSAFLKQYNYDFLSSDFAEIVNQPDYILVWRNREDEVCYQQLNKEEWTLLHYFTEHTESLSELVSQLAQLGIPINREWLFQLIDTWVQANVLIPQPDGKG